MKNIVFITASISFGGASKMLCFVAESLASRGHNVSIVNLKSTQNASDYERIVSDNVTVCTIPSTGTGAFKRFSHVKFIKNFAKSQNADVIIGFTTFPNLYAKIVGDMLRIPSIMSERGDPSRFASKTLKDRIVRFLINRSSGGVFQTQGAMDFYSARLKKRGIVIPNPIFIDEEVPNVDFADREKTVVSVGRFDNFQKRYDIMLDAFKLFSQKHPEYVLKLYGIGNDEDIIRRWVAEKGIVEKVKFMGLTHQTMQDICRDGMFLITSDFEGISNSLLEAMAVGLPCISTDHTPGGARLLIKDHKNGLLAPMRDPEKLALAMCEFAENTGLAVSCGENAKGVVNTYDPPKIIDMWETYVSRIKR